MKGKKIIAYGEEVPVKLTVLQRDIILEHTPAGPELTDRLRAAPLEDRNITAYYSLDDLDRLAGFVAAEAKATRNSRIRKQMQNLCEKLVLTEEAYLEEGE
jgi:hypothetical protein